MAFGENPRPRDYNGGRKAAQDAKRPAASGSNPDTPTKNPESAFAGSGFFFVKGFELKMQQSGGLLREPVQTSGSEPSAAGGRCSEVSERQRSKKSRISVSPMIFSGTATGEP